MKFERLISRVELRFGAWIFALGLASAAQGAILPFSDLGSGNYSVSASSLSQSIPDNNLSGVSYPLSFGVTGLTVNSVTVSFNSSGGWNGDVYAYLSHGSDVLVLLDRVGVSASSEFGYGDAGFSILLSDAGSLNIHNYGGNGGSQLTGTYLADGQTTSPNASFTSFSAGGGSATFDNTFGGVDPNGSWTLFFADASGGSTATLNSWSVDITTVPETANIALGFFGVLFVGWKAVRSRCQRNRA